MRTVYAHANTWNSCLKTLEAMGYRLSVDAIAQLWIAESSHSCLRANNPIELLGLAQIDASTAKSKVGEQWWGLGDELLRKLLPAFERGSSGKAKRTSKVSKGRSGRARTAPATARLSRTKRRSPP